MILRSRNCFKLVSVIKLGFDVDNVAVTIQLQKVNVISNAVSDFSVNLNYFIVRPKTD
jgi:hypothetical protein